MCRKCWARAALVVSHVCSAWRKAAECPRVWFHIYINCGRSSALNRMKLWLSKAHQSPLYINLGILSSASRVEEILSVLLEHSTQWRNVTIRTQNSVQLNSILSRMHYPFPQLRGLDCITRWDTSTAALVDFSAICNAPVLCRLHIEQSILPPLRIPLQLTDLYLVLPTKKILLNPVPASRWTSMLANLPCLKHLWLELSSGAGYHYELDTTDAVELPQLESIVFVVTDELLSLLSNMRTPALRKFILRCFAGQEHASSGSVIRQFLESSPGIELLELHDVDLPRKDLAQCFTLLPRLERLHLHGGDVSDEELELLYGPTGLCPNLFRLNVRWCMHLNGSALAQLVRSRNTETNTSEVTLRHVKEMREVTAIYARDGLDLVEDTTCRFILSVLYIKENCEFCWNRGDKRL